MTSTHRFLRPFQGFSRLVRALKGLTAMPVQMSCRNPRIFLKLECLYPNYSMEVTAAMPKLSTIEMLCITCKESPPKLSSRRLCTSYEIHSSGRSSSPFNPSLHFRHFYEVIAKAQPFMSSEGDSRVPEIR